MVLYNQDFENAYLKQQSHNFSPPNSATQLKFKCFYQLYSTANCVKKGYFNFRNVLEHGLLCIFF